MSAEISGNTGSPTLRPSGCYFAWFRVGTFHLASASPLKSVLARGQYEKPMSNIIQMEMWPIERLIPYARNARTHSDAQVAQIAASIAEFGFINPVLAQPDGGIIAGHGRVLAARKLKRDQVPVIVLGHLDENQKRAFISGRQ